MAATKRIEWTTVGYWGQWEQNLTLWNPVDADGVLWSQVFKPHSRTDRFSMTKVRFKMWRTGTINTIALLIIPIKSYSTDGYNYAHVPEYGEDSMLATAEYTGVIPESDPGDDTSNWIEFVLDEPLIVEGGYSHKGYAILIAVSDGAGTLHWAYSMPKTIPGGCGEFYKDGYRCKGEYPYALADWWNIQSVYCTSNFLFEIWGDVAAVQIPLVRTKGYKLDKELPHNCTVRGGVHPWCGAKITNKGIRWYKDGDSDNKFWKDIDVSDDNYNYTYQDFEMELTDLEYDTVYHYRVEATNSEGTGIGEYESFTSLHPENSLKIEIKAEATATALEIEKAGNCETLLISNHLIQTKELAQEIADYYLEEYKEPKIVIRGTIVTPAPYERRDAIVYGTGEILNYTKAISAEIPYAAAVDAIVPYDYYDVAKYGRMNLKKINPVFSAGNYVAAIELERKY